MKFFTFFKKPVVEEEKIVKMEVNCDYQGPLKLIKPNSTEVLKFYAVYLFK